jgi:hypothetical protein
MNATKESTFKLLFLEDPNIHPVAKIFLQRYHYNGLDEFISVTPDCANAAVMHKHLDRLQAELDMLHEEVDRQFASERPSLVVTMNSENPDDNAEAASTAEASFDAAVRHLASLDRVTYESVPKQEAHTSEPAQCFEI